MFCHLLFMEEGEVLLLSQASGPPPATVVKVYQGLVPMGISMQRNLYHLLAPLLMDRVAQLMQHPQVSTMQHALKRWIIENLKVAM